MSARNQRQWEQVKYSTTRLGGGVTPQGVSFPGGLDLVTPSLSLQPGAMRDCVNFECAVAGGYARIGGYERFSGLASPSAALYKIVQLAALTNTPTVGQTVTQASSGASGVVAAVVTGSAPYLVLTKVSGTFDTSGVVVVGATTIGTAVSITVAVTSLLDAQYLAAAADIYRADISAVPGSGAMLGVVSMVFNGVDNVYAFRANAGATAVAIYKSSAAGWVNVPFYNTIQFNQGGSTSIAQPFTVLAGQTIAVVSPLTVTSTVTVQGTLIVESAAEEPQDGDTLIQGAVSATIKRVMTSSGTWAAGTAAGSFVLTTPVGGSFISGQPATTASGAIVNISSGISTVTMALGGHFEFVKCNFSGNLSTRRIYGCDGVNQAFEFDGETLAPITTGNSPDAPNHIAFHKNYLFLSQGSSLFYPGAGTPFRWSSTDGGGEIATGDSVTGMLSLPGSQTSATLAIFLFSNTAFLYGTDPTTFNYVTFNTGQGALPYTAQNLADSFVFDAIGIITLRTTLNYGNFLPTTLTHNILPFIIQERTKITTSAVNRTKSQYRVFFNDGYALWLTMINQQYLGAGVILFPNPVSCCDDDIQSDGTEVTYFGSSDGLGYVYQMDVGTSFDGGIIDAHATMAWDPLKSPRLLKRWRAASIEMQGETYANIQFGYQLGYGTSLIGQPTAVAYPSGFMPPAAWDSFTWDNFFWDGQTLLPTDVDMTGTAENVQVTVSSTTNYIGAYTLNSLIYHYSMRRGMRV